MYVCMCACVHALSQHNALTSSHIIFCISGSTNESDKWDVMILFLPHCEKRELFATFDVVCTVSFHYDVST